MLGHRLVFTTVVVLPGIPTILFCVLPTSQVNGEAIKKKTHVPNLTAGIPRNGGKENRGKAPQASRLATGLGCGRKSRTSLTRQFFVLFCKFLVNLQLGNNLILKEKALGHREGGRETRVPHIFFLHNAGIFSPTHGPTPSCPMCPLPAPPHCSTYPPAFTTPKGTLVTNFNSRDLKFLKCFSATEAAGGSPGPAGASPWHHVAGWCHPDRPHPGGGGRIHGLHVALRAAR